VEAISNFTRGEDSVYRRSFTILAPCADYSLFELVVVKGAGQNLSIRPEKLGVPDGI
jgi:hypothetical protein